MLHFDILDPFNPFSEHPLFLFSCCESEKYYRYEMMVRKWMKV